MVRFSVGVVAGSGDAVVSFIRFARATRSGLGFAAHQIRAQLLGPALLRWSDWVCFSLLVVFSLMAVFYYGKRAGKAAFKCVSGRFPHYVKRNAIACLRFA